jgi:hypothetical protein
MAGERMEIRGGRISILVGDLRRAFEDAIPALMSR